MKCINRDIYEEVLNDTESIFDGLPILNVHSLDCKNMRASIDIVEVNNKGEIFELVGSEPEFSCEGNSIYNLTWKCNNKIVISFSSNKNLYSKDSFLKKSYIENKKEVDSYIPKYKRSNSESKIKPRTFKPKITPEIILKQEPIKNTFIIDNPNENGNIYYTLDGSNPNENSLIYNYPIVVDEPCTIKAIAINSGFTPSEIVEGVMYSTLAIENITSATEPVNDYRYNRNGVKELIDGEKGSKYYTDGKWLGYFEDLDVTVDLGKVKDINNITVGFLQDTRAWIYYPKYVEFEISNDGKNFKKLGRIDCKNRVPRQEVGSENIIIQSKTKARYIRIFAKNEERCPKWGIMADEGPVFMFVDQITVN